MLHRRLDDDWDYVFGHGKADYLEGREAVGQTVKTRLLLLYGEWWEDQQDGLPLFEKMLGSSGSVENLNAVDIIIRQRIEDSLDVLGVTQYDSSFDRDKRAYNFSCRVESVYGELYVSNVKEAS